MFGTTLNLVALVGLPYVFGTLKDGRLTINSLPLNDCFSYRNILQNGVKPLSKMVLKFPVFCRKIQILYISDQSTLVYRFCSNFASMWSKYISNTVWKKLRLMVSAFPTVERNSFNGKFTVKVDFPIGHFMLPLMTLTLEV